MFYLRVARPALARTHTYTKHSGLLSFASTTLILSLVNAQSTGVVTPNVVVGMALFVGGLAQLLAGMWEFAAGNTFGATGEWPAGSSPHHSALFLFYSSLNPRRSSDTISGDPALPTNCAFAGSLYASRDVRITPLSRRVDRIFDFSVVFAKNECF